MTSTVRHALHWPALVLAWLLSLGAVLWPGFARAQDVQPVPALSARVIDQTATLSSPQRQALESKLAAFESSNGSQIIVLMVTTTAPEEISAYAQRVADTWKIGRRGVGDGLLIVVAKKDRAVRIEVAKALEGAVPDLAAFRIIDKQLRPAFQAGDFAGGLNAAIDRIAELVRAEKLPPGQGSAQQPEHGVRPDQARWQDIAAVLFPVVVIAGAVMSAIFGRGVGSLLTGGAAGFLVWMFSASIASAVLAGIVAWIMVGVMGGSGGRRGPWIGGPGGFGGGGWGGGSGGGFSSGGGGDFGGGGASGRW